MRFLPAWAPFHAGHPVRRCGGCGEATKRRRRRAREDSFCSKRQLPRGREGPRGTRYWRSHLKDPSVHAEHLGGLSATAVLRASPQIQARSRTGTFLSSSAPLPAIKLTSPP
jgi:hypothetical protein